MTFWAGKTKDGKRADVHVTSGPISISVEEDPGHLRHFWGELGRLLDELEKPEASDAAGR